MEDIAPHTGVIHIGVAFIGQIHVLWLQTVHLLNDLIDKGEEFRIVGSLDFFAIILALLEDLEERFQYDLDAYTGNHDGANEQYNRPAIDSAGFPHSPHC